MDLPEAFELTCDKSSAIRHALNMYDDKCDALKAACVILYEHNRQLVERMLDLESIAPRFTKTSDGQVLRWDAPTDLAITVRERLDDK